MRAGVIGYPIHHSKSPIIHNYWMNKYNISGNYQLIEIKPDELKNKVAHLIDDNYDGFNVTIPFKEKIFDLCDEVDETAKVISAVNTVIIKDKKLIGKNTDAYGFIENIKSSQNIDFIDKKCLILGAGGAARAVIYGLLGEGVDQIYLTNRTKEKADTLKTINIDKIEVIRWDDKESYLNKIDLLVNTTSLGMLNQSSLEIDLKNLNKNAIVSDIIYNPLKTNLLVNGSKNGNKIVTGIGMLLHQARPAFKAWTGVNPDITDELIERVLA